MLICRTPDAKHTAPLLTTKAREAQASKHTKRASARKLMARKHTKRASALVVGAQAHQAHKCTKRASALVYVSCKRAEHDLQTIGVHCSRVGLLRWLLCMLLRWVHMLCWRRHGLLGLLRPMLFLCTRRWHAFKVGPKTLCHYMPDRRNT